MAHEREEVEQRQPQRSESSLFRQERDSVSTTADAAAAAIRAAQVGSLDRFPIRNPGIRTCHNYTIGTEMSKCIY